MIGYCADRPFLHKVPGAVFGEMGSGKDVSVEARGVAKRMKVAASEDGSTVSDGETGNPMMLCEEEHGITTTAEVIKRSLKAAKKKFRERVGKVRTVMKFGMAVEERVCEIYSSERRRC